MPTPHPILTLIRKYESDRAVKLQKVPSSYDVVYGKIKTSDRPSKLLTTMTIREVLAWQDSIDYKYSSEAAGAYQFMEDTLRDIVRQEQLDLLFDKGIQDALAINRLEYRGWQRFLTGDITLEKFGNHLAMEWASLPVLSSTMMGHKQIVHRGQSYYAGDGVNKAHAKPEEVEETIISAKNTLPEIPLEELITKWIEEGQEWWNRRPI
jgi:muramidase (phage lysozyme)